MPSPTIKELNELMGELAAKVDQIGGQLSPLSAIPNEVNSLKLGLGGLTNGLSSVASQVGSLSQTVSGLMQATQTTTSSIPVLQQQVVDLSNRVNEVRDDTKKVVDFRDDFMEMTGEFKEFRQTVGGLKDSYQWVKRNAITLGISTLGFIGLMFWNISSMSGTTGELKSGVAAHRDQLKELKESTQQATSANTTLANTTNQLADKITELQKTVGQIGAANIKLSKTIENHSDNLTDIEKRLLEAISQFRPFLPGREQSLRIFLTREHVREKGVNPVVFEWPLLEPVPEVVVPRSKVAAKLVGAMIASDWQLSAELTKDGKVFRIRLFIRDPALIDNFFNTPGQKGLPIDVVLTSAE